MSTEMWIALLSLVGTLSGSFSGIMVANRLVNFRLEQLEKKVEKHNNLIERVAAAESEIKSIGQRIDNIERAFE